MRIQHVIDLKKLVIKKDNIKKLLDTHRIEPLLITIHDKTESINIKLDPNQLILNDFLSSEMDDTKKEIKQLLDIINGSQL